MNKYSVILLIAYTAVTGVSGASPQFIEFATKSTCFRNVISKIGCRNTGVQDTEFTKQPWFRIKSSDRHYFFETQRRFDQESCDAIVSKWRKLLSKKRFCLNSYPIDPDEIISNKSTNSYRTIVRIRSGGEHWSESESP